jgi:hypothetical protein
MKRMYFRDGPYLHNTASFGGFPICLHIPVEVWKQANANQEFTFISAGRWERDDAVLNLADNNFQIDTYGSTSSTLTVRGACTAYWTWEYDVTFDVVRKKGEPWQFGWSWAKKDGIRFMALNGTNRITTTGFTGTLNQQSPIYVISGYTGYQVYVSYTMLLGKRLDFAQMESLFADPYQFLVPA